MKVSLSWLKDFLETTASVTHISETLTSLGLVVEEVINPAEALGGFLVAEITSTDPHPNADTLQVCQVTTGSEAVQVVCGAPNARPGLKGVLAQPGQVIPQGGLKLRPTKIRGVESAGMLCSASELGLAIVSGEAVSEEGILELDPGTPVGREIKDVLGLEDPIFDLEVTPNRGDCFGIQGVARELAAAGLGTLKTPQVPSFRESFMSPLTVTLDPKISKRTSQKGFEEACEKKSAEGSEGAACPYFTGRVLRGLHNGPSPEWLQKRLQSVGLKPISALVDITNYMMLAFARPLHVFDADTLSGTLTVRFSEGGETFQALDEKTYDLPEGMSVICDEEKIVSLAGIMGSMATGCTDETRAVFLESAYFSPIQTARMGQALGLVSDARTRFERGTDPAFVKPGLDLATQLILEVCGGEASHLVEVGQAPSNAYQVNLSLEKMASYTGVSLGDAEARSFLDALGCQVSQNRASFLTVTPPSWRHDLREENDLIEELLRLKGYAAIPQVPLPPWTTENPEDKEEVEAGVEGHRGAQERERRLWSGRRALASQGYCEVMTWSFIPQEEATLFGGGEAALNLDNPLSQDMKTMRPSLLPGLMKGAQRNQDRGQACPRLFEVGACYRGLDPEDQETLVAGVRAGRYGPRHWRHTSDAVSAYDVKQDALTVLAAWGVEGAKVQVRDQAPGFYHPGRSGRLCLGPKVCLAHFGEVHPKILKSLACTGPVVAFEIFLNAVPLPKGSLKTPPKLSPFQPVERDLAFILEASVPAQTVMQAVRKVDRALITSVDIFDTYKGAGVPEGHKSLALTFRLEPHKETLTDAMIHQVMDQVIESVTQATGGVLRS